MTDLSFRRLGDSDLEVSVVGIGCNNFGRKMDSAATQAVVDAALDAGVNFFDTADIYAGDHGQSEELLGAALGSRRDQVLIATKFGSTRPGITPEGVGRPGTRAYIRAAAEASLRRLGTDRIDLYQMHTPDAETPLEETIGALDELVREGKVRAIGNSNFAGWQIAHSDWISRTNGQARFVSAQNRYSLVELGVEEDVLPACVHFGLGMLPFFPLASGLLTGKYRRGQAPPDNSRLSASQYAARLAAAPWDRIEALEAYAARHGVSILDVAIGGLAAKPAVASVIAGATTPEQVRANVAAGAWRPAAADPLP